MALRNLGFVACRIGFRIVVFCLGFNAQDFGFRNWAVGFSI